MSQPPSGVRAVPTISPFSARQSACPSGCHPVSVEPLNVQSGTKLPLVPDRGAAIEIASVMTAAARTRIAIKPPRRKERREYTLLRAELRGVVGRPLEKRPWRFSCELHEAGAHKRRLPECGCPRS